MRISDWSSDVCSSDLRRDRICAASSSSNSISRTAAAALPFSAGAVAASGIFLLPFLQKVADDQGGAVGILLHEIADQVGALGVIISGIGRASGRERVCQSV